jgi:hypothetical protein
MTKKSNGSDNINRLIRFEPIENLLFDPQNPRLPKSVAGENEQSVLTWMLRDATILELMGSIGEKDYFPGEPLLIVKTKKRGFYVVEGNRRLCAVKLLSNPRLAPVRKNAVQQLCNTVKFKPKEIPVLEFNDRNEILDYLGYRHITGVKEWGPLAKARYLDQLRKRTGVKSPAEQHKILAKTIGSTPSYVARLLTGLRLYEKIADEDFFDIETLDEDSINFSILTTALSYSNLVEFLGLKSNDNPTLKGINKNRLKEFTSWLFQRDQQKQTKLGESRNLKRLNVVVKHEEALTAFKNGYSLQEAELLTEAPTVIFKTAILAARKKLIIARTYIHLVQNPNETDVEQLEEILKLSTDLKTLVSQRLSKSN